MRQREPFDGGLRPKIQEGPSPEKFFERTDPDLFPPGQLQKKMILFGFMAEEKAKAMTGLSVAKNPPDHAPLFPDFRNQPKGPETFCGVFRRGAVPFLRDEVGHFQGVPDMANFPGLPEDLRRKGKGTVLMAPVPLIPKGGTGGIVSVGAGGEDLKDTGKRFQKTVPDFEKSPGGDPVCRFGKKQETSFREVVESGFQGGINTAFFFVCLFRQDIGLQKKIDGLFHPREPGEMQNLRPDNPSVRKQGPDDLLRNSQCFPGSVQEADFQAHVLREHR